MKLKSILSILVLSIFTLSLTGCFGTSATSYNNKIVNSMVSLNEYVVGDYQTEMENVESMNDVDTVITKLNNKLDESKANVEKVGCYKDDCKLYDASINYLDSFKEISNGSMKEFLRVAFEIGQSEDPSQENIDKFNELLEEMNEVAELDLVIENAQIEFANTYGVELE